LFNCVRGGGGVSTGEDEVKALIVLLLLLHRNADVGDATQTVGIEIAFVLIMQSGYVGIELTNGLYAGSGVMGGLSAVIG
jgi:hypothetical protein